MQILGLKESMHRLEYERDDLKREVRDLKREWPDHGLIEEVEAAITDLEIRILYRKELIEKGYSSPASKVKN